MSEKQQRLVLSIIDFLNQSVSDGTVKEDDKEGLEVAIQCIGEAFGVDPSNSDQVGRLSVKPATLQSIFDVYLKTRDKVGTKTPEPASSKPKGPSAADKAQAEKLKQTGNNQMSSKQYDAAIESYTQAVALDDTNPVYYSNRAAAHSSKGDHLSAISDAEKAISVDPKFVKAYHRLGHAYYSISDFKSAKESFERGLELDPKNSALLSGVKNAEARITDDEEMPPLMPDEPPSSTRNTSPGAGAGGLADMLSGLGGGAGGMPDLASLMNNPQMMAMAQQLMSNGGLANLMQNPGVQNMMDRMQSGNMPSMAELMSDPTMRSLAEQFGPGARGNQ